MFEIISVDKENRTIVVPPQLIMSGQSWRWRASYQWNFGYVNMFQLAKGE